MDFEDLLRARRMVRRYSLRPIPPEVLERILDRARRHPSAGFAQGIHFVLVTGNRSAIASAAGEEDWVEKGYEPWLSSAPAHVVICAAPDEYRERYAEEDKDSNPDEWRVPYWWVDAGAALMLLLLAAVDEGLAAGFLGVHALDSNQVALALELPAAVEPIGVVTLGYPAPDPVEGSRNRPRRDTIHRERW